MVVTKANSTSTKSALLALHWLIFMLDLKFMTNAMILISILLISHFVDGDVPPALSNVVTFHSSFSLQACLIIWLTSMLVTKL